MNKRNKPASLTSSLLARKGEAEPAIEPYSFLESGEDRADSATGSNGAGVSQDNSSAGAMTGAGTTPGAASDDVRPTVSREGGGGDDGWAPTGPDGNREAIRDRRLLRFVYATAALTGVLAVVIYAGGWFFGGTNESPKGRTRVVVLDQPKAVREEPPVEAPMQKPVASPPVSAPPKPPAPPTAMETVHQQTESQPAPSARGDSEPSGKESENLPKTNVVATETKIEARPKQAKPTPSSVKAAATPRTPPPAPKKTVLAERATGTPAPTASGRYYIQLASVPSELAAKKLWTRLQKNFPDILGEYDLTVQKRVIANKGTFYRVQVGRFAAFEDVRGLCDLLASRKQPCLPVKR